MRSDVLTQRHRARQIVVQRATVARVRDVWPVLDWADLDGTYPALAAQMAPIVAQNRLTSASISAAYSRAIRAKHVRGSFQPILPPPLTADQFAASLRATSIAAIKSATANGVSQEQSMANAQVQTSGSMSRLVLAAGLFVVTQTAARDPRSRGWQRVGVGECNFCTDLLSSGTVYSEASVDFQAHDHCTCMAQPVYA